MFSPLIFRANDIRGRWLKDFDLAFTKDLALGLCVLAQQKKISQPKFLLAYDARLSGPKIAQTLARHLKHFGAGVSCIGLAPSPLCYFLIEHYQLTACVVVTASHNPSAYNGFKILFQKKHRHFEPIQALKKIILSKKTFPAQVLKGFGFKVEKHKPYLEALKKEFQGLKKLPFAIDTGGGALGPLAKKAYSALGLKPIYLFNRPDGHFSNHHPDPTVEKNLRDLKNLIKVKQLALGFGFDGDGDRVVLLNSQGKTVLGDEFGFLFFKSLKKRFQKKIPLVLADVKCSDWLFSLAKKQGIKLLMTKSGHGLMRRELERKKALLAIEFSGHIFFKDRKGWGSDDALYASLRLLELLSKNSLNLEELLPKISSYKTKEIRWRMPQPEVKLALVKSYLKSQKEPFKSIDGIRLSRTNSWALFRSSKTEEALTMRFEAPSLLKLKELKKEFSKVLGRKII